MAGIRKWKNNWNSPEYNAWIHMIHRCTNPKDISYKTYGALGITVCKRWINDFDKFVDDMGKRPSSKHSLERVNVNKGYSPSNCVWALYRTQAYNKRNTVKINVNGNLLTTIELSEQTGISQKTIRDRIYAGKSTEQIASKELFRRSEWEHGTIYGYIKHRCRCDSCKLVASNYKKQQYIKQKGIKT